MFIASGILLPLALSKL